VAYLLKAVIKAQKGLLCFLLIVLPVFAGAQEEPDAQGGREEYASELNIEDLRRRILNEAPPELMSYTLGDSEVSLFLTGSWYGELQGNLGFFFSPLGNGFTSPDSLALFKQEVDLTLSLWIIDRWFVEVNFLDNSNQNTYRAGYQGKEGEFVRYAGIGNTGLDYPSFPYLDLGGDSPSSYGFYSRFAVNDFNIHALVRYDAASREERVFSGNRERTYNDVSLQNSTRGISFVLPDENIDSDIIVYIEDQKGTITDNEGRRWRLALNSEYASSRTQGLLELSVRPSGMVSVSYSMYGDQKPWDNSLGSYSGTPFGFLTEVQNLFDPARSKINLSNFPQCGGENRNVTINGKSVLVIYQPGTFSPFERRNRFDSPSSASETASLVELSSGKEISGYELVLLDRNISLDMPIYTASASQRAVYELVRTDVAANQRNPASRFPLASKYPEIYLPANANFTGDVAIRFTNYNSQSGFFIGTDVIPGSIQVYRSGIQDSNFNYNSATGEVGINGSIGQNEIIRITYLKKSDGSRIGSIAAGVGAVYEKKANPFSAMAAVGIRWNVTDDSFTEENNSSVGTVGISAKTAWDYDYLNASIKAAFTFVQTDTTGLYRVAGMEGHENIINFYPESSFLSNSPFPANEYSSINDLFETNRADLIYRNYNSNSVLGSTLMPIDWNANTVISGIQRPYPAKDPFMGDVQILAGEFTLDSSEKWTGFQFPLEYSSEILSRASEIEIPFRLYGFSGDTDPNQFKLIIQIGSLSGKDNAFVESGALVWEEEIFPFVRGYPEGFIFDETPHIAKFNLNESDRQKLGDSSHFRIIAVYEGNSSVTGRVLLAPPIVRGSLFRPVTYDSASVSAAADDSVRVSETRDTGVNTLESSYKNLMNRLHAGSASQRILEIEWKELAQGVSAGADGRLSKIPLSDYNELSFFARGPSPENKNGNLRFIIASGPESVNKAELEAVVPLSALSFDTWKKVTIRYQGNNTGVTVDGISAQGSSYNYRSQPASNDNFGKTNYIAVIIESESSQASLPEGVLYIDEIILEDSCLVYRMNAGTDFLYSREGTIVSAANIPVLSDFSFYSALESEARSGTELLNSDLAGSLASRTSMGISVLGADISGNFSFTSSQNDFNWSADHSISRSISAFHASESFAASPKSNTMRHNVILGYASDFHARFSADALYDLSRLNQKWNVGLGYRPKNIFIPSISVNTDALWISKENFNENENYGELWVNSFSSLVPDSGIGADSRKMLSRIIITQRTKPVGAIITLEGNTNTTKINELTRSESSGFLDIPIAFDRTNINFRIGRKFTRDINFYGNDASYDGRKFLENLQDSIYLWGVLPFYSLFSDDTVNAMEKSLFNSPSADFAHYTLFTDHASLRLNFPSIYNLSAFVIPTRITFRIERKLEQKLETASDSLNVAGSLGFSAINTFGAMGHTPVFKFYQSDEFSHVIESIFIFPKNEDPSWRISSILSAGFRGFSSGVLNLKNTFTIRSAGNVSGNYAGNTGKYWLESFTAFWEAPNENSIIGNFYKWITSSLSKQSSWNNLSSVFRAEFEQLRKESLEITFDRQSDNLRWSVTAGHEGIVRILGRLNFTAFFKFRLSEDTYTEIFTIDAKIGTTLRVIF